MQTLIMNLNQLHRRSHPVFPLQRIGFLIPIRSQARMTFVNKLELCLRLASDAPCAVDEIDGIEYRTPFPHVVLKLPGSGHTYEIDSPREAVYLQYAPELEEAMRSAELLNTPRVWQVVLTPEIYAQLHNLRRMVETAARPGVIEQIDLAAMSLFEHLIVQDPVRSPLPGEVAERIGRITTYLHLHFTEEIDLDDLIRRNGFSRRTFFRCWSRVHSAGPANYLCELRIRHAAELLLETDLPVSMVAMKVNLRNIFYFSRQFRRYCGMTPLEFRKRRGGAVSPLKMPSGAF